MSDTRKTVVCILSSLTLCAGAKAIVADSSANPYQGIVDRNVFGLKPPTPSKGLEPDKPAPPKITLTGITTIFHDKRALMNVAMPARPPEPAKQQSFILAEHQREGDIEVLEIDVKTGDVKVSNFGTVVTLNLEKDGAKLPNTPALSESCWSASGNEDNSHSTTPFAAKWRRRRAEREQPRWGSTAELRSFAGFRWIAGFWCAAGSSTAFDGSAAAIIAGRTSDPIGSESRDRES